MENGLCISENEVAEIIITLQMENHNWDKELILRAIQSCCVAGKKDNEPLIGCVRERVRMLREL